MGPLGHAELRQGAADAGRAHRALGSAGEIRERASGGARMSRAVELAEQVLDLVGDRAEAEVVAAAATWR